MKEKNINEMNKNCNATFAYYSKLLKEPFDSVEELREAEEAYYAKLKAKEDKAAAKKADAQKVEDAFKALNAARKIYKEDLTTLTAEYSEALTDLKKAFDLGKSDIREKLATAEATYQTALKEFNDKHPEGYHVTLKDGDFETTIEKRSSANATDTDKASKAVSNMFDILDWFDWFDRI